MLIVPRSNPARIRSVFDLRRRGIKLVIGQQGVPIGAGDSVNDQLLEQIARIVVVVTGDETETTPYSFSRRAFAGRTETVVYRPLPTSRDNRCVPAYPGRMPRLISGCPIFAVSAASRSVHAIASSQPPPRA